MSNGIGAFEKFQLRADPIQNEEDKEAQLLAEKLADPNYMPTAQEAFDAVNFIAEEYNPINKDKISAKQAQVGTNIFDMAASTKLQDILERLILELTTVF